MTRQWHFGWGLVLAGAALVLPLTAISAEPYLAVRTGLKCAQCHVNRSGGGGRNAFGNAWAQTQLPMRTVGVRSRSLSDWVAIGFDLRALGSWNAGVGEDLQGAVPATAIEITDAQVQLEARLIDNRLAFYVDQTLGPERAYARELFGLIERLPMNGYVKAGKFLLPYGWRLWDDGEFIREESGFTYRTPDLGVEFGVEPGRLSWFVAVTNGSVGASEGNSGKMISSTASFTFPGFRVGASAARNRGDGFTTELVGAYAGLSVGPVALLGEVDAVFDSFDDVNTNRKDGLLAFVEGDVLLRRGMNLKITHGFHDPTASIRSGVEAVAEDQRARTRVGLETFPVSFVQVSAFYTRLDNAGDGRDVDQVSLELHLHF
jgi:hypothetical protein